MLQGPSIFHRPFSLLCLFCMLFLGGWSGGLSHPSLVQAAEQQSLYERLGGYDTISEIIDGFLNKMFTDPQVGRYFVGMGADTREQLRQKNKLLMCKNTGGPCKIINRDMKLAHAGLGVTESDWQVTVSHLAGTLESLKIGKQEHRELLQLISSLKKYIVEVPSES